MAPAADTDLPPVGFAPLANATEGELFNGPFYIRGGTLGFRCKPRHINANGTCHGGHLALFADMLGYGIGVGTASGAAPTVMLAIDFLAPVRLGDWVEATPEITRDSRSLTFFHALMRVDGTVVARCNGIYKKRSSGPRAAS
ncbi:MAG: hypothetical protein KDK12_03640 [Rhodobacteraceae bacterium]|nr:hypothetical protein [Paracoccaceae bacterium]